MKKVLITGQNSYLGTSFTEYVKNESDYSVDSVSVRNDCWKKLDFAKYDVVYHVAGLVHKNVNKLSEEQKQEYFSVNTDLTLDLARKAKEEGVKQFIFVSTASVYGEGAAIGKEKIITKDTQFAPINVYGQSKLQAEKGLRQIEDDKFKVVILRPPMIYGKGCKGNYVTLSNFVGKTKIFPFIKNQRSMIYIGNLCELVKLIIDDEERGIYCPQNKELVNTSLFVKEIALAKGKKLKLVKGFGWLAKFLGVFVGVINKVFGNFTYSPEISEYKKCYNKYSLEESLRLTESRENDRA